MSARAISGQVRQFGHRPVLALSKPNARPTGWNSENVTEILTISCSGRDAENGNCQPLTLLKPAS